MAFTEEVILSGFGGQGVLSMGKLLSYAGLMEGKNVSWFPSYGPEMRGGTANCNVIISDELVGSPVVTDADTLIVMNQPSLEKFESHVKPGGMILVNSSLIEKKVTRTDVKAYYFPVNEIAAECGSLKAANMVMLGAYMWLRGFPTEEELLAAFLKVFGEKKKDLLPLDKRAIEEGMHLAQTA